MGLFGKKRVGKTVDFTKMGDARVPMPRDLSYDGDAVDLRNASADTAAVPAPSGTLASVPFVDADAVASPAVESPSSSGSGVLDFMEDSSSSSSSSYGSPGNVVTQISEVAALKTQLRNMTGKMEDTSNEVYRMLHRIELLERKLERFENGRG